MQFKIEGEMNLGRERRRFSKEISAPNERVARELLYADLGSRHGLKRSAVTISEVKKV